MSKYRKKYKPKKKKREVYSELTARYYDAHKPLLTLKVKSYSKTSEYARIKYLKNLVGNLKKYPNSLFVIIYKNGQVHLTHPYFYTYVAYYTLKDGHRIKRYQDGIYCYYANVRYYCIYENGIKIHEEVF